ncbi:hypothetical protein V3C99_013311, partial [Haemonchus contortus]
MGSTAPSLATCYRWYGRFSRREIHLDEAPRSRRPCSTKTDIVLASVRNNPSQSLRGMERTTSAPRSTIHDILRRRRFRAALPAVIPHTLTESERWVRVDVCRKLLDRKRTVVWTSFFFAQDEKWISYENPRTHEVAVATNRDKASSCCKAWGTRQRRDDLVLLLLRRLFYYEILPGGVAV